MGFQTGQTFSHPLIDMIDLSKRSFRMNQLHEHLSTFLQPYLTRTPHHDGRPLVILTWAQSLDAKISAGTGQQTVLSCLETKYMTHLIRRKTDAILIGAETAVIDNPSLNGIEATQLN